MKLLSHAVVLAAASSLVAGAVHGHGHNHRHLHKRDTIVETISDIIYVYQVDGVDIDVTEACKGLKEGKFKWADSNIPEGACGELVQHTSFSTITTKHSTTAPVFFQKPSSTSTTSSTTHPTPTPTPSSSSAAAPTPSTPAAPGTSSGGVTIINNVQKPLYLWSTSNLAGKQVTIPVGGTYSETWKLNPDMGGVSIKIATTPDEADVLQFEYTLVTPTIWWDVSLINMAITSLFDQLGFTVTTDDKTCRSVTCPAGDTTCNDAYLYPTDDQATRACPENTNMVLNLGPA